MDFNGHLRKNGTPYLPNDFELRSYQNDAINEWFKTGGKGVFKMATGSGKTVTALSLTERLFVEGNLKTVIILVPYKHLVTQWNRECLKFGLIPICCFENRKNWTNSLEMGVYGVRNNAIPFLTVIVTNSTFQSVSFQSIIDYLPNETLLIGDEAHNLGTQSVISLLPNKIELRLALSATPERWFDEDGTEALLSYFGPVLYEFTLADALQLGALVPYKYYPIQVNLTEEEAEEYCRISKEIAKVALGNPGEYTDNQTVKILLNKRARLIGVARNKLVLLRDIMKDRLGTSHTIFYCGDGSVDEKVSTEFVKQIDLVSSILGYELGFRIGKYTANTPLEEREKLRVSFDNGDLDGLVAIRCLDEGVDIPSTTTAIILASSSNPKQFIQRRGRVLRRYPGKKIAEIFDMIVLPPNDKLNLSNSEKTMLQKEFNRYREFATLAINSGEIRGLLTELEKSFGLL